MRAAFHLKDADGIGLLQQSERLGIFLRQLREIDRVPAFATETKVKVGKAAKAAEGVYRRYLTFGAIGEIIGRPRRMQPVCATRSVARCHWGCRPCSPSRWTPRWST